MSLVESNIPLFAPAASAARWRRLAPSVVLGLSVYFVLICVGSQLLNDPDTQWHIAVGWWIWANGRVPTTDIFSHTFYGAPWIAKEWGAQLILFAAHQVAGWSGVVGVAAAAIATTFAMLHEWLRLRLRPTVALALTLIAIVLCAPHLLARPHALVLPVMLVWVMQLVAAHERDRAPSLWLTPLMALWANLHGSFPLGLMLATLVGAEGVLFGAQGTLTTRLRTWALFVAGSAAATLASPYGWRAVLVPLQMASKANEALPFIGEWQPLAFDVTGLIAVGLGGALLCALASSPRTNIFRTAAVLLLAVMMVRHSRFVDQFALLAPVLCAGALAARPGFGPTPQAEVPRGMPIMAGVLVVASLIMTLHAAPLPNAKMAPEDALRAARAHDVRGPVYNAYDFGGFLIAHEVPTFVDGRTDQLFLGGFLTALDKARTAKTDEPFAALLARHHVTWALVRPHSAEACHLARMTGWLELYNDGVAAVFAQGSARP